MRSPDDICARVNDLKSQYSERDGRHRDVYLIREGQMAEVFPEIFGENDTTPLVADMIDVVARDLAEMVAPLPSLNTSPGNVTSDRGRARADKRKKIGLSYWTHWRLQVQMIRAVDDYFCYGYVPFQLEPDFSAKRPGGRFLSPRNGYPEFDKYGNTVSFTSKVKVKSASLAATYPEWAWKLMDTDAMGNMKYTDLHLMTYLDKDQTLVYVEEFQGEEMVILESYTNRLGKCPVICAVKPGGDGEIRGQFDGALGALVAKALMARLGFNAAEMIIDAPVILPTDVQDFNIGAGAIIRTDNPAGATRMRLDVGNGALLEQSHLDQELRTGVRYPDSRSGNNVGSIVTGKGVDALNGTFDSQVNTAQMVFAIFLREVTQLAFELDEKYWPNISKDIRGVAEGVPFSESYTPKRDIHGEFLCDCTYGMMAGMDPNRGLIWILQALSAELIDSETAMRNLPFEMDVSQIKQNIDVEQMRKAGLAGIQAMIQAIGPMAEQGGDPSQVLSSLSQAIADRKQGKSLEESLMRFAPPPPPQPDPNDPNSAAGAPGAGGQLPPGMQPSGLLDGVAPGQAGEAPGGRPGLTTLLASLGSSGKPNLGATVRRSVPIGG